MFLGGTERPASIMKCVIKLNTQKFMYLWIWYKDVNVNNFFPRTTRP